MAQVFPLNDDLATNEARQSVAGTLAALPDPWTLLRDRRIGGEQADPVEVVLIHPEIGVALVDQAPRDPAASALRLRQYLDEQRFGEFFPGDLPIVALSVDSDHFEALGEQLAAAFEVAPRLSLADTDWADAVIELLMVPDDLAMTPVGDTSLSIPSPELAPAHAEPIEDRFETQREQFEETPAGAFDEPPRRERFDVSPRDQHFDQPPRRERFDDPPRREYVDEPPLDLHHRSPRLDRDEPPLPLMVDWPFAASYRRQRRRGRIAALVVIFLLLGGAGFAAWQYAGEDLTVATNDMASRGDATLLRPDAAPSTQDAGPRSEIELPLPQRSSADQAARKPPVSSPPPVPAAPPVVMAQKPYASPPPTPPKPTPVEPLPRPPVIMAQKSYASPPPTPPKPTPVEPLPQVAAATAPPADSAQAAPAKPAPPAAAPPARPKPATRTAKIEPPPPASRTRASNSDNPPIDAADLPPLDEPSPPPQRPTQLAAPGESSVPPAAGGLGPPVPLWRAQAHNAPPPATAAAATTATTDARNQECRPYTSSTTLTGRGLRVEGIACRGADGQWRLVSEVPLR